MILKLKSTLNRSKQTTFIERTQVFVDSEFVKTCDEIIIGLHTFDNTGVKVLQLSSVLYKDLIKKTEGAVIDAGSITSEELAKLTGIAIVLAKERLLAAEQDGKLCRDDSVEGLRFYPNLFLST